MGFDGRSFVGFPLCGVWVVRLYSGVLVLVFVGGFGIAWVGCVAGLWFFAVVVCAGWVGVFGVWVFLVWRISWVLWFAGLE